MVVRKICVVTGSRAEYGLLRNLLLALRECTGVQLQIIATGMHLSPEFGLTFQEIESDGFRISKCVETLLSADTPSSIAKSTGLGLIGFADAIKDLNPDLLVVVGDRFEIVSAVISCLFARIPVAHIHGGETTRGAFDEAIRHSITKMSSLHFVAAEEYRNRVIQLGEHPDRVFLCGSLGVDTIFRTKLFSKSQLEIEIGYKLNARNIVISYHPETLSSFPPSQQFEELLNALELVDPSFRFVFTMPNADTGGREIINLIEGFVQKHQTRASAHTSLGSKRYWSLVAISDVVVGNSSSGLIEAPSLGTPTVNIGNRQAGRLCATSVINTDVQCAAILAAIQQATSADFMQECKQTVNPYGGPGAVEKIVNIITQIPLDGLIEKSFFDIPIDVASFHDLRRTQLWC